MPAAHREGDAGTGHGCWAPRTSTAASGDVYVNGIALHREGDAWGAHTCPAIPETHASVLGGGSSTVFINGKAAARIGDPVACGSSCAAGSEDVFIGG